MLSPDLQEQLFSTSKEESLIIAKTTESQANLWFKENYLSFDISKVDELQYSQVLELTFISQLFKSTLALDTLNQLLLKLPKPYSYNYHQLYFNVFSNEWEKLPEEVEELNEEEVANNYLNNLNAEENREEIENIIYKLESLLT
jgi:hypothetical protein